MAGVYQGSWDGCCFPAGRQVKGWTWIIPTISGNSMSSYVCLSLSFSLRTLLIWIWHPTCQSTISLNICWISRIACPAQSRAQTVSRSTLSRPPTWSGMTVLLPPPARVSDSRREWRSRPILLSSRMLEEGDSGLPL